METQVRTPQMVFMQPQRLVVPLFQRPYVWNEENQWEPLWNDVVRVAERVLARPAERHHPHFLGAVVLQQVQRQTGQMQERTIIDGQQRLTTLQLLLDALHAELLLVKALPSAMRLGQALDAVESWMVRRMLVRATTKNYNQVVAELVALITPAARPTAGDVVETFLAGQSSGSRYWPDDAELRAELQDLPAYRRLGRGRLRMVLEGIEDDLRGWRQGKRGLGDERVARGKYAIEHVMPRRWSTHWELPAGTSEAARDRLIHTFGNLTLLNGRLNSKASNGPWLGEKGKREALEQHDVFLLNRELLKTAGEEWTDQAIQDRTRALTEAILRIWPVPPGHTSGFAPDRTPRLRRTVGLIDLINGGVLTPGMPLIPARRKLANRVATLLPEGQIEVDGVAYANQADAASAIVGKRTVGWWFFLVDQASRRSLRDVRRDYVSALAVDVEDDDADEDDDDE